MNLLKQRFSGNTRGVFLSVIFMILTSFASLAQSTVMGTITEANGEPIPGVSIIVESDATIGTVTDFDGLYSITVPDGASLIYSFVGMTTQTIVVGNQTTIDLVMGADATALEEIVVVGYGTQFESRITGSVGKAEPDDMVRVSTPTVGQALQGRVAGVFIKNQNGQPGSNKTNINVRGQGEPLYIVDGLPVDASVFASLNPNDIEELNVLKDAASAAVYGARAGNGVILVTTKRGTEGGIQFSYKGDIGFQGLVTVPDAIDSWQHMALFNLRRQDRGQDDTWSAQTIADFRANQGLDPENYPNTDMFQMISRNDAPMMTHDLSVRGGSDNVRYFISGNIFDQEGLEVNVFGGTDTKFKRYNVRGNVDVDVTEKLNLNFETSYNLQDFFGPRNQFEGTAWSQGQGIWARSGRWRPFYSIEELPGGHLNNPRGAPGGQTVNPLNLASAEIGGSQEFTRQFIDVKLGGGYKLPLGLSTRAVLNYQTINLQDKLFQRRAPEYRYNEDAGVHEFVRALNADTRVLRRNSQTENINFQAFLNGEHSLGDKHSISSMYVFEFIQSDFERFDAGRIQYQFPIAQLNAGPPSTQVNDDVISRNKRMGHIGRVSYNYDNRYSLEVSARYDGSIRFPKGDRWGFFPSVSGAWNVSEEAFMKNSPISSVLTYMKVRSSWGRLGFDGAGDFQFLPTFSFDNFVILGGSNLQRTISSDGLANPSITWEKMDIINLGIDVALWDNKLEGSVDIFQRDRFDVLGQRILEVPPIVGAELPQQNFQEFQNKGIELSLRHNNRVNKDWSYAIGGNVSIYEEIVKHTDEADFINKEVERREKQIGRRTNLGIVNSGRTDIDVFYLENDGLFTSQEEIDNWADIDGQGNRSIQIGDLKVIDRNGDGRITDADKYIATSGTSPRLIYGFNTRVGYKGFELSTFWQGAGLFGWNLDWSEYDAPFPGNGVALQKDLYDAYVPDNEYGLPTTDPSQVRWPRASGRQNEQDDAYLINGSYLRLKQLQFGYTLPAQLLEGIGVSRVKLYAGGTNLLTFSDLDFLDPEIDEDPAQFFGNYHPQTKVLNFGIEIDF